MGRGFWFSASIGVLLLVTPVFLKAVEAKGAEPEVPAELKVPAGHKLLATAEAKGVQIYKSVAGKGGKPEWVLDAPLADLFGKEGKRLGCHYEGPSWEAADGSKVSRDHGQAVKTAAAPNPKADIPWLLVKVKAVDDKEGALRKVLFIQRIGTKGGQAPAEAPARVGTKVGVGYTAVYRFYGPAE